jgi:hypothetical protein
VAVGFWQDKNKQMITRTVILAGLIILLLHNAQAQNETSFTQNTTFDISTQESKISFGVNGTYTSATLTNGTWSFTNLKLNGSQTLNTFKVSAKNSNITINSLNLRNTTSRFARLRYVAEGTGEQTFQMGITAGEGRGGLHPEWSVIVNDDWLGEGEAWTIIPDGTITIKGVTGNIYILHYNFLSPNEIDEDLPFYEQHSVSITTIAFAGSIVILGTIIRLKTKRHDNQMTLPKTKNT